MKLCRLLVLANVIVFLSGCVAPPSGAPAASNSPTLGQDAVLIGTGAAGAAGGYAINKTWGGPAGAAVGLAAGLVANSTLSDHEQQIYNQGLEDGKRIGRLEVMRKITASQNFAQSSATPQNGVVTHYESGVVEGVRMTARDAISDGVVDPQR
jgi:hypothetical protein